MKPGSIAAVALVLTGCGGEKPVPPPALSFQGLPVAGTVADAQRAGFTRCLDFAANYRCRRAGIRIFGAGPFEAAVDARGRDGAGGFDQLTIWDERDQHAVSAIGRDLVRRGWQLCRTGQEDRGDQNVYTKAGSPVRISIDVTYWGKRRLRVLPERGQPTGACL